jgi:endonuclease/exonuclease/phosphatase family metal-dependent hydrolase
LAGVRAEIAAEHGEQRPRYFSIQHQPERTHIADGIDCATESVSIQTLSVLSFNVAKEKQQLEARMNALATLVADHQPDLVMLQELSDNKANKFAAAGSLILLQERLQGRYDFPDAAAFALQGRGFKVAILVRRREPPLRLEELRVVLLGTSRRPAMLAACHMPTGETIAVASCHLSPDFNVAERAAQILQLHGELKGCGCEAELIAGDTNMSELDKDAVASVKDGFVDCWRPRWTGAIGVDCAATFQGDGRTRPRAAGDPKAGGYERIDRFFVRGAIRCTGMEVTGRKPLAATTEGKVPDWWGNERSGRISDHLALRGMFAVGPSS